MKTKIINLLKFFKVHYMWRFIRRFFYQKIFIIIPDKIFVKIQYFLKFKNFLNLDNPKTFTEKLQYLKLNQTDRIFSDLADKFKVREYIREKLGEEVLTKLYWHGKNAENIPFDELPNKFVIKCNHGSGYNIIVDDKLKLDKIKTIKQVKKWMEESWYIYSRQINHKKIDPVIIIEEFLEDKEVNHLYDYKFWCFNGKPKFMNIHFHEDNITKINIYDIDGNIQNFGMVYPNNLNKNFNKPKNLEKMLEYSKILSKEFPFARIDLYEVNGKIYFGEITFTPTNGLIEFHPNHNEMDKKYLEMIDLKDKG